MKINPAFKFKIKRKIEDIPAQDWSRVYPKAAENYYFFKTLDESKLSQFSFFYILVYYNDDLVSATNGFIMNFPLDIAVTGALKSFSNFIKKLFPALFSPKILICGLPMGQGRIGLCADARPIIETIYAALEEIARQEKASIIAFKDFDNSYIQVLDKFLDKGFFRISSMPSTDMEINFSSFEEYARRLSSASRSGLKRKFKSIDGKIKIDLEITDKLENGLLNEVYALYLQTYDRQEMGLEKLSVDFFRNISINMPQETKFFLWKMDNKLVAFAFCLVSGDNFVDYYLGFDYKVSLEHHLYFVRFRDLMNWCLQNKIKRYEMGVTGYEPKRRLGFSLIPLYIYVKHRNKSVNVFFKVLCRALQPSNFQPVFKNQGRLK